MTEEKVTGLDKSVFLAQLGEAGLTPDLSEKVKQELTKYSAVLSSADLKKLDLFLQGVEGLEFERAEQLETLTTFNEMLGSVYESLSEVVKEYSPRDRGENSVRGALLRLRDLARLRKVGALKKVLLVGAQAQIKLVQTGLAASIDATNAKMHLAVTEEQKHQLGRHLAELHEMQSKTLDAKRELDSALEKLEHGNAGE